MLDDVPDEAAWVADGAKIAELLYALDGGDTFAYRFEASYGVSTKHATVTDGPFVDVRNYSETTLAEPYDVVARVNRRRSPSDDNAPLPGSISHDPETDTVYLKRGPGRFDEIVAVTTDTVAADYEPDAHLAARCDDCGLTYEIPVTEDDLPVRGEAMLTDDDGRLLTPCCRTDSWTTTVEAE